MNDIPRPPTNDPMRLAVQLARQCAPEDDGQPHPRVGAVVVEHGEVIATAFRGEVDPSHGPHAEFIALELRLPGRDLSNTTIYTTLEPCTGQRTPPKQPCCRWIIQRGLRKVVIGILDPNPNICGRGEWILLSHGIEVDRFPSALQAEIRQINADFIDHKIRLIVDEFDKRIDYFDLEARCPVCDELLTCKTRYSTQINHIPMVCSKCRTSFEIHTKRRGFYTTYTTEAGEVRYGLPPQVGFEFVDAMRWALVDRRQKGPIKGSQGWVEPDQFKRILRLLEHIQTALGPGHSPKQLLNAMLQSDVLPSYEVSREQVRSFFRLLTRAPRFPYFTFESRGSKGKTPYTNSFDAAGAIRAYLDAFLFLLRVKRVLRTVEQARYAARLITRGTGVDVEPMVTDIWSRLEQGQ